MALPTSGPISMGMIRTELGVTVTGFKLRNAEQGLYVFINQFSPLKPNGNPPHSISKWYGYNHTYNSVLGEFFVGGKFNNFTGGGNYGNYKSLVSIKSDGSFTNDVFNSSNGIAGQVIDLLNYGGKLFIVGNFLTYKGVSTPRITYVDSFSGDIVTNFIGGVGFNNITRCIAKTNSGAFGVFVGGQFTTYKGVTRNRIIKINDIGSEDTSFVVGTGFNNTTYCMATDSSNNILVGGQFTTYKGVARNRIAKLLPNGSLDTSFVVGTGFNDVVRVIKILPNGNILVGGQFTTYNGVSVNKIARLLPNGSLDTSFYGTINGGSVYAMAIDSNQNIYAGGQFSSFDGTQSASIHKFTPDGSTDPSFNASINDSGFFRFDTNLKTDVIATVNTIHINQENPNQLIVGGWFDKYNGIDTANIVAISTNGTIDLNLNATAPLASIHVIIQKYIQI